MTEPLALPNTRLVCMNFQAPPRCAFPLSPGETQAIATEALPRSLRMDVYSSGFRALKLFPIGKYLAFSHIFDGGAVDEWDRPVLSARVALVAPSAGNGWGRDLRRTGELLAGCEKEQEGSRAATAALENALGREALFTSRERWAAALTAPGVSTAILSRVAYACARCRDVVLVSADTPAARQILSLALALVPDSALAGLRLSTACANLASEGREEIVFQDRAPGVSRPGLWSRLTGRTDPRAREVIDLKAQDAARPRGAAGADAFAAALEELLDASPWPELSFPEMHRRVLLCLEALAMKQARKPPESITADLSKETAQRVNAFFKRAARG